ncbi:MAG TPA: autotransporter domain-containing protein [Rhodopseudomonas sp.]|uniref:autotransporter family protein n=1 Tax=Rhodopseudomonas sp. TaxID=1078 RepID=UPI002ED925F5
MLGFAGAAQAQTANVSGANVNVLNLLAPFLGLNFTAAGQATLQANLQQTIKVNTSTTLAQQQLAISDKNLLGSASNNLSSVGLGTYGVAANLAGGLPAQTPVNGITPQQAVGGFGAVLGSIYQTGVANGTSGPLANTVRLLTGAYNFTSSDLGVAKNYFANGAATNPSSTPAGYVAIPAVAPAGYTLPTFNGLPNTTNSVYDLAYGVTNTQAGQDVYGSSRPVQVARSQFNVFDPTALSGLETNPSFPSGHTTYAFTDSMLLGILVPELYQSMLLRASEYGNSRIALGVHYPLDIIASRSFVSYELAQALSNPNYVNNTTVTGTAIDLPTLVTQAKTELNGYLSTQCGATVASCASSTANTANDPYVASAANQTLYQSRLTYGLPTLSYAEAPREAAPSGGPDASILLATVYGGSTAAAQALAPSGGIYGNLQTSTINQIIVNTEGTALAAFYGTALSYWSRLDLYSAIGYFQNVTGTITLAPSDVVSSNVTVGNTGVLAGTGTVASTIVTSGGALQPGNGTAGSSLKINGSLALQSGALYVVQVSSAGAPLTSVSGTAALAGGVQVASPTSSYKFNTPTTILNSAGLGGSRFATLTTPTGISGALSYSANAVSLNLSSSLGQIAGANANQRAVGAALDSAFNAAGSSGALGGIFAGNVGQNLAQAAGQAATGTQQTTFNAMTQFTGLLLDPTIAGRGAAGGAAPGALSFADEDGGANAYAATGRKRSGTEREAYGLITKAVPRSTVYDPRWSVWAAGFGGSQSTDGNVALGSETTTSRIYGVAVGADYYFSPETVAGFALAGGATNYSLGNGLGSGKSDLFQAGAFVRHSVGPTYLSAALAYGWQDITTDRTVTIAGTSQLRAQFNANALTGRVEGGYRLVAPVAEIGITPYAAGQFTTFDLPAYGETALAGASAFALNYASKDVTDTRSELGLRGDKSYALNEAILTLRGRAAWAHDFNNDRSIGATFQSLPLASFVVNGAAQAHDLALTTASAELQWRGGISVAATFEGEFSDVSQSYAGKGVVRYSW